MAVRPWYRDPWIVSFVAGVLTLTVLWPRLRYEPVAPPPMGELELADFVDASGRPVSAPFAQAITVVGFIDASSDDVCGDQVSGRLGKLWMMFESIGEETQVMTIALGPADPSGKAWGSARHRLGTVRAGWRWVGPRTPAASARVSSAVSAALATWMPALADPGCSGWPAVGYLSVVDGEGRFRGFYEASREDVMSEVLHRSRHVRASEDSGLGSGE